MNPSVLFRTLTGIGGERPFVDVSGRPGTVATRTQGDAPTVVAIHGFTGVPAEVSLCADAATKLGLATSCPLLAGHGTHAGDLAKTSYNQWLSSARDAFTEARQRGPVILVGLSLGSLLATDLTLESPGAVAGLVLLSNAFWLRRPHPGLSLALADWAGIPDCYLDKSGPDLGDVEARRTHVTYDAQPLHASISLERAGVRLRDELFRINRPTLIVHGARDQVCPVQNAWKVAQRLGTRDARVVVLPRSKHIITRDVERTQLADELTRFFSRVRSGSSKPADRGKHTDGSLTV